MPGNWRRFLFMASLCGLLALCWGCVMKAATVYMVEIDGESQPVFPQRCIACARIGSEMPVSMQVGDEEGRVDYYLYGFGVSPSQGPLLTVPIHDSCAKAIRNDFLKRLALILLLAASVIALGLYLHHGLLGLIAAVIISTPLLYIQMMKPVPFEFYKTPNSCVFIFANREYAREFAWHNGVEVVECEYSNTGIPVKSVKGRKE